MTVKMCPFLCKNVPISLHTFNVTEHEVKRSRVSRKCIVGTPAGGQGSKAVGVACLELGVSVGWLWWWTVLFESYWRLCAWSCDLIGHLVSPWPPRRDHNGYHRREYSKVSVRRTCIITTGETESAWLQHCACIQMNSWHLLFALHCNIETYGHVNYRWNSRSLFGIIIEFVKGIVEKMAWARLFKRSFVT
jgi:hypothetical protein